MSLSIPFLSRVGLYTKRGTTSIEKNVCHLNVGFVTCQHLLESQRGDIRDMGTVFVECNSSRVDTHVVYALLAVYSST